MTVELKNVEDIRERLAERQAAETIAAQDMTETMYRYVRPFSTAADSYIDFIQNPEGRFMFGLSAVDVMTRGIGRGELLYVVGRAHSGKTQVCMSAIQNNPNARILMFTPDEVSELVLAKLAALHHGVPADEIEEGVRKRVPDAVRAIRAVADMEYPNLVVIDQSLTLGQMMDALKEAEDWWQADADAVFIDTVELLPGSADLQGMAGKSAAVKRWGRDADVPLVGIRQSSRSSGPRGQSAGIDAAGYAGETDAIFMFEVFRRTDDRTLDEWERRKVQNQITVSVVKNKRPPCKKGECNFYMDPRTGRIREELPEDLVAAGMSTTTDAATALRARGYADG